MDEYSFISENGTVRQIRDLVAKAKDEEQDGRITDLEQAVSSEWVELWQGRRGTAGVITLTDSIMNYSSVMVAVTTYQQSDGDLNCQTMEVPKQFYYGSSEKNKIFAIIQTVAGTARVVRFQFKETAPYTVEVTDIEGTSSHLPAVLAVYGRK